MRQTIAFKILDIILLLSLRIGPEQTRIEMSQTLKAYFDTFSLTHSSHTSSSPTTMNSRATPLGGHQHHHRQLSTSSKPLQIDGSVSKHGSMSSSNKQTNASRSAFKAHASIAFASLSHHQQHRLSKNESSSVLMNNSFSEHNSGQTESPLVIATDYSSVETNSIDGYMKYSYDQNTNEIVDSPLKAAEATNSGSKTKSRIKLSDPYKFRTQSIGLLSLNNDGNTDLLLKKS